MNNKYIINENKRVNSGAINSKEKNIEENIETLDISNGEQSTKINVLKSIKNNIEYNRRITNEFNKELYNRINKEIKKIAQDERVNRHASR
ncbi:MAG: hypothetical protein IJI49_05440 [Bacilli bacterium]|nr:hypothetical protein [Bacilli bacterium]